MKKIFLAFAAIVLLISCSDDDGVSRMNTNGTRVVKGIVSFPDGTVLTSEYFYNGNQLVKTIDDGLTGYFNYSEGLLVDVNNGGAPINLFEYDIEGKLINHHSGSGSSTQFNTRYIYNSDGTVTATSYTGEETPANITQVATLYFEDGELVKKVLSSPTEADVLTYTFTYDNQNNPNLSKQGYYGAFFYRNMGSYIIGNTHNVLSVTCESTGGPQYYFHYTYEYNYNSYGYPITQRKIDSNGNQTGGVVNYYYE